MQRKILLCLLTLCLLLSNVTLCFALSISPEMELLAGVLSQTSWIKDRGPKGQGNEYFRALQEFFSDYREHKAIALAEKLNKAGFTYDAPPAFICHLGPLPDLDLKYEYSEYLVNRAGGRGKLEEFRVALVALAQEADFLSFFQTWLPYLEASLEASHKNFSRERLEGWLEEFFGWSASEFYLIMTPSMFPGGGYGASVTTPDGGTAAFQIIRENGWSETLPEFPTGVSLENLTIHELGHSFVNPSLEAYPERAQKLRPLLAPVRQEMKSQAYPTVTIFLNEQVLRGVEVISARELFNPEIEKQILLNHEKVGFYLTRFVVEQLEYYQANRSLFPTFKDFVPYLYDQLDSYQKENSTLADHFYGRFLK